MTARYSAAKHGARSQIGSKPLENISYPANAPCPHCGGGCMVEVTSARSVGSSEARGFLAWSRNPEVPLLVRWLIGILVWTILVVLYLFLLYLALMLAIMALCTVILYAVGGKILSATALLPQTVFHTWHEDHKELDAKCKLCGRTWTWRTDEPLPAGRVDTGLIAAGTARLEEERRDEERRQLEAAHWNSWHNPDNPWNNPGNTSSSG